MGIRQNMGIDIFQKRNTCLSETYTVIQLRRIYTDRYLYHVDLRGTLLFLCKKILLRSTTVQVLTYSDDSA